MERLYKEGFDMFANRLTWRFLSLLALLALLAITPTLAQDAPRISLAPSWRPASTLDSIDMAPFATREGGDDFRYVDAEIYVTTTVPFWSAQVTCTVASTVLTSYNQTNASDDGDPGNFNPPVIWGPDWGIEGTEFAGVVENFNVTTGARTITASRLGNRGPMGSNGYAYTFLLATLRYRVKDLITATGASPLTCTGSFLNRNGGVVIAPTVTAPAPLSVIGGYTLSGVAQYQGRASQTGITVNCDYNGDNANSIPSPDLNDFAIVTSATGAWTRTTRAQGFYNCEYYGDLKVGVANTKAYEPERFLAGWAPIMLNSLSYTVLPVTLRGGNLSLAGNAATKDEYIDGMDLGLLTAPSVWNMTSGAGDINGDGKSNQADLSILASNWNYWETDDNSHVIYSMPRNYNYFHQSGIWLGRRDAGEVTRLVANTTPDSRDMWATLSPDGKQVAFVRDTVVNGNRTSALYTAPIINGVAGTPVRVTPVGVWYQAFAPSWSPDGTRLAFVCSWFEDGFTNNGVASGFLANMGDLCVIDATGRNYRQIRSDVKTKIYPPAWFSNTELVYGGSAPQAGNQTNLNSLCADTLCYANLTTNEARMFDVSGDATSGGTGPLKIADMPVIPFGDNMLLYRFYDSNSGTHVIRWSRIDYINPNDPIDLFGTVTANHLHQNVVYDTDPNTVDVQAAPLSTDIGYFNVKTTNIGIIYTAMSSDYQYHKAYMVQGDGNMIPFAWEQGFDNAVFDQGSNPTNPTHTPYNYTDVDSGTWSYAYRNTAEWTN